MSGDKEDEIGMLKCKPHSTAPVEACRRSHHCGHALSEIVALDAGLHANLVEDEDDKYRCKQQGNLGATSNMDSPAVRKDLDNDQLTGCQRSKSPDRKNAIQVALTVIPLLLATVEVLGPNDVREPRGARIALRGTGSAEVEGKGGEEIVAMTFLSVKGQAAVEAVQEIHLYSDETQAKRAFDDIAKKIKRCNGKHQPADDEGVSSDPAGGTTTLTNGTKKAPGGDPFLWVRSTTTVSGSGGLIEHENKTVRHFGSYLQIVKVDSEGVSAPKISAKQIRIKNLLTDCLGDRWSATFS
jgi:hypothetical protein